MADKEYIERMQVLHEIGWLVTQKQGTKNGYFPNRETLTPAEVRDIILNTPAADVVSRNLYEQIKWERDLAMEQLKDHKIPFGCIAPDVVEVVRCKECKSCFIYTKWNGTKYHGCCFGGEIYEVEPTHFCSYGERKE